MVSGRIGITVSPLEVKSIWTSNFASPMYMKPILLSDFSNPRDVNILISLGDIENLEDDTVDIIINRPKVAPIVHNIDYWPINFPSEYYYLYVDASYIVNDPLAKFDKIGWWICRIKNEEPWYYLKSYSTF